MKLPHGSAYCSCWCCPVQLQYIDPPENPFAESHDLRYLRTWSQASSTYFFICMHVHTWLSMLDYVTCDFCARLFVHIDKYVNTHPLRWDGKCHFKGFLCRVQAFDRCVRSQVSNLKVLALCIWSLRCFFGIFRTRCLVFWHSINLKGRCEEHPSLPKNITLKASPVKKTQTTTSNNRDILATALPGLECT